MRLLLLVAHDWRGVAASLNRGDLTAQEVLRVHVPELRQPGPDVVAFGIELAGLSRWVEDPEGLGVHPAAGTPLPITVVSSEIPIQRASVKSSLAEAPLAGQILHRWRGNGHSAVVMLPATLVETPYHRIGDQYIRKPSVDFLETVQRILGGLTPHQLLHPHLIDSRCRRTEVSAPLGKLPKKARRKWLHKLSNQRNRL